MPKVLACRKTTPKLEGRTIPILIGEDEAEFHIHEDRLCLNSAYFMRRLQPKRKPLKDKAELDCSICTDPINLDCDSVTVCLRQCGQTFHAKCLNKWFKEQQSGEEPLEPNCPYCRSPWQKRNRHGPTVRLPEISANGFSVYRDWLYDNEIRIGDAEEDEDDEYEEDDEQVPVPDFDTWLAAYFTGIEVEDNKFCLVLCEALVELCNQSGHYPDWEFVQEAWKKTEEDAPLRTFIVGLLTQVPQDIVMSDPDTKDAPTAFFIQVIKQGWVADAKLPIEWDLEEVKQEICLNVDHVNPPAS